MPYNTGLHNRYIKEEQGIDRGSTRVIQGLDVNVSINCKYKTLLFDHPIFQNDISLLFNWKKLRGRFR